MKKFKSPDGSTIRITIPTGEAALISGEWRDLPERMHQIAYASGCISDDMIKNTLEDRIHPKTIEAINNIAIKEDALRTVILQWIEDNDLSKFSKKGIPNSIELGKAVGFNVDNAMRDRVWYRLQEETDNVF